MKLTVNFGRDEIMNAIRDDSKTDDMELFNSFSYYDRIELMQWLCTNDSMEQVVSALDDTIQEFDNEGLEEFINVWRNWLTEKRIKNGRN